MSVIVLRAWESHVHGEARAQGKGFREETSPARRGRITVSTPSRKSAATSLLCIGPGKLGAGNPHAGFYLRGEAQGQPRLLPTDHTIPKSPLLARVAEKVSDGTLL